MKKYIALFLWLNASLGYAISNQLCPYVLNIVIQNDTKFTCQLIQHTITSGNSHSREVPLQIPPTQKSLPYTLETEIGLPLPYTTEIADVTLSYRCGEDKIATFSSKKLVNKRVFYNVPMIEGVVISLSNMDASYHVMDNQCNATLPRPDTIIWGLY